VDNSLRRRFRKSVLFLSSLSLPLLRKSIFSEVRLRLLEPIYPQANLFQRFEVELSTVCVSKCFACPRTKNNRDDHGWNVGHMNFESLMRFLTANTGLQEIVFCGAYGDPIYHPQLPQILRGIKKALPACRVFTETNGSHRDPKWWAELGEAAGPKHTFSFSLDGLEDSNHIYRVGTNWESIIEGAKALRKTHRGIMLWKMILFSHNEHQVNEMHERSLELGFNSFKIVESVRHTNESIPKLGIREVEDFMAQKTGFAEML
jgi:sulfatase maturation enzyme AslB (radical SAM superfamily)